MSNNDPKISDSKKSLANELEMLAADDDSLAQLFSDSDGKVPAASGENPSLALLKKIPVRLTLEVDSVEVMLGDVLEIGAGQVLPLDKKVGEPLNVRVNGTLVAQAEVVVVDGKYGLRITDVLENITLPGLTGDS